MNLQQFIEPIMTDKQKLNALKELLTKEISIESENFDELNYNHIAMIDKAYELVEMGDFKEALELFTMVAADDESDPDILNGLGITLSELGRLQESQLVLEKAARLNPHDAAIYSNLAGVYWDQNELDKAIYFYNKAIELDPEIEDTYLNLIYLYMEAGSLYMAFINCLNIKKIFPDNDEVDELMEEIILNLGISIF